jgi:hypothetical protein
MMIGIDIVVLDEKVGVDMWYVMELWRAHHGKNNNMLSSTALK